ncbi:MAG: ATP-binding protein [Elusimicrobiota bacterium]
MLSTPKPEKLALLLEVGRLLASKLELPELLQAVMELAAKVVDAETASLLLLDEETQELYFDVALGLDPEVAKIRLKLGEGIAGTVAQSDKPVIIDDVQKDPRWSSATDEKSGFVTRSILGSPLKVKGRVIGVIEAINKKEGRFEDADMRVFEAFAAEAAIAIENARLFSEIKEEKFKLTTLLDEMRDAAILTDGKGGILVANKPAQQFFTSTKTPQRVEDVVAGMTLTPPLEEIIGSKKKIVRFEARREEPKLILAGTASLTRDPNDGKIRGRVIVFRDVTLEKQEEGLKRSFLSLISHKLKTPLASINGFSQLLLEQFKDKPEGDFQKKSIATINMQGNKLTSLVEKLLNYTVLEEIDSTKTVSKNFAVEKVLQEAIDSLEPWLEERKGRAEIVDAGACTAVGDPILVRDAIKNLIENGIKFCKNGEPIVKISAARSNGKIEIRITDKGPGIAPEELEKIFMKFYQIDASFTGQVEGWGLGLPFARKVAEKLGGSVRVDSRLGEGTTAVLSLPAAES